MNTRANEPVTVLAILSEESTLPSTAGSSWRVRFARGYDHGQAILEEGAVEVIVSAYQIDERHTWRDLLRNRSAETAAPPVIVVDRNADEKMWVEVLSEGAFDLVRAPLNHLEIGRLLSAACPRFRQLVTAVGRRAIRNETETSSKRTAAA